jgi:hypothetical protein
MHFVMEGITVDSETLEQRITAAHKLEDKCVKEKITEINLKYMESKMQIVKVNNSTYVVGRVLHMGPSNTVVECSRGIDSITEPIKKLIGFDGDIRLYSFNLADL